jgi:nicotinate dehydrogenase subunit B
VDVGTGAETALAQIAAEELDFPFDRLSVVMGTTSETVDQGPSYGSRTIRYAGPQIRQAAAAGRQALLDLAAAHFNVPADQLSAENGTVSVRDGSDRAISYGRLIDGKRLTMEIGAAGTSFDMVVSPKARPKDPSTYRSVGKSFARKDIPAKIRGTYTYIQDVKVEGMLHGRIVRPYGVHFMLVSVDESGLRDIPGFVQLVRIHNFLGVVAGTEWAAIQAAQKLGSVLDPQGRPRAKRNGLIGAACRRCRRFGTRCETRPARIVPSRAQERSMPRCNRPRRWCRRCIRRRFRLQGYSVALP